MYHHKAAIIIIKIPINNFFAWEAAASFFFAESERVVWIQNYYIIEKKNRLSVDDAEG